MIPHHNKRRKIPFLIQLKSRNQKPVTVILNPGNFLAGIFVFGFFVYSDLFLNFAASNWISWIMKKSKSRNVKMEEIKNKILGGILIAVISYFIIVFPLELLLLKYTGVRTMGIITRDLIGVHSRICNKYTFEYKGERYEGNSQIPENPNVVGDSIEVIFLEFWPSFNRPVSYFEE